MHRNQKGNGGWNQYRAWFYSVSLENKLNIHRIGAHGKCSNRESRREIGQSRETFARYYKH